MEWSKVKNIIILILLLVNGFLLVIVGARMGEVRRYEKSAMDQAVQVLGKNGIQIGGQTVRAAEGLTTQTLERSPAAEMELACGLLGEEVVSHNQGGGLYTYQGNRGTVSIRGGGRISVQMTEDDRWQGAEPETLVRELLSAMKIEGEIVASSLADGTGAVTVRQLWQDVPLFSCRIWFNFEGSRLVSLSGTLLCPGESSVEHSQLLTVPSALLTFLDEILSSGDVCSAVDSMEPGYRVIQSFSGTLRLEPVWLISSNTADYYMDAVTGELSRPVGP